MFLIQTSYNHSDIYLDFNDFRGVRLLQWLSSYLILLKSFYLPFSLCYSLRFTFQVQGYQELCIEVGSLSPDP